MLLLGGLGSTAFVQARSNARLAEKNDEIALERDAGERVIDFLVGLFESPDPRKAQGETVTAKELLDRGAKSIDAFRADAGGDLLVWTRLMDGMSEAYHSLGLYDEAEPLVVGALGHRLTELGEQHPDTIRSMNDLGHVLRSQGSYDAAEEHYRRALELGEQRLPGTATVLDSVWGLGRCTTTAASTSWPSSGCSARSTGAASSWEIGTRTRSRRSTTWPGSTAGRRGTTKRCRCSRPRWSCTRASRVRTTRRPSPRVTTGPACCCSRAGAPRRSRSSSRCSSGGVASCRPITPTRSTRSTTWRTSTGWRGATSAPRRSTTAALDGYDRTLGSEHPNALGIMVNLASVLHVQDRPGEAEPLFRAAYEVSGRVRGETHPTTLGALNGLAQLCFAAGRYDEAEPLYAEALAGFREALGESHPNTLRIMTNLVILYERTGAYSVALPLAEELVELTPEDDPELGTRRELLDDVLSGAGE